jgi:hypothetical protein
MKCTFSSVRLFPDLPGVAEGRFLLVGPVHSEESGYIGKGVPSERLFRGNLIPNTRKPVRGRAFGGRERSARCDAAQGHITGTAALSGAITSLKNNQAIQTAKAVSD